ncbi:hypothetical protein RN001_001318 [Aquatica leii]|uniref:THAP-type domain-containing protein n=1 Tax=Aquatica leii TaxID=1421715 RepID=A0AAN7SJI7_9COLE|nr:hypothetical protein RN001_001318 [Aquatica leii]
MGMCWAPDCKHHNARDKCKFLRFPKSQKERSRWKRLLRRDIDPGSGAYVCSCHFREGKKENGPELFLHNISKILLFESSTSERNKKTKIVNKKNKTNPSGCTSTLVELSVAPEVIELPELFLGPSTSQYVSPSFHPSAAASLEAEIYFCKQENEKLTKKIGHMSVRFTYETIQGDDRLIVLYTGLFNSKIFESLFNLIKDIPINYYLGWDVEKIAKIDQLILLLIKLRQNFPHMDLAQRFSISQAFITNIILTYVHVLYEILYKQPMGTIPSRRKKQIMFSTAMDDDTNILDIRTYDTTSNEVEFETKNLSNLEETILTPAKQAVRLSNLKKKKFLETPRTSRSATASLKRAVEIYQKAQDADSETIAIKLKIKKGHLKLKYYKSFKTFEGKTMSDPKKRRVKRSKNLQVWLRWFDNMSSDEDSSIIGESDEDEVDAIQKSDHDTESELEVSDQEALSDDSREAPLSNFYIGKDKVTKWKKTKPNRQVRVRSHNIVKLSSGTKGRPRDVATEIECLKFFVNETVIRMITVSTNVYILKRYKVNTKETKMLGKLMRLK